MGTGAGLLKATAAATGVVVFLSNGATVAGMVVVLGGAYWMRVDHV